MKKLLVILLCITSVAVAAAAKGSVKISGLVTDQNNEPLEFVTVKVGKTLGTTTGLDGRYALSVPEADTIRIVFSCIGYEQSKRRLVGAKEEATVNVKMQPLVFNLGGVEVTDYRKQLGAMQKLDRDDLRRSPDASGGSVESLLTTLAGVTGSNELSSRYSVRGGNYDENSVYINGVEIYRPQFVSSGQQEGMSAINPDMVGAIGFSTGGFAARYGDRMSSVLDIVYREPEAFEGSVSTSLMGTSAAVGSNSRRFSQLHGIRYKQNSSLLGSLDDKGDYDPRFFDYQTNMTYRFSDKLKFSVLGNIAVNNYKFIPHNRTTKFGTASDSKEFTVYFDGMEKDRFETYFGAGTLTYTPNKVNQFELQASGFFTNELVSYDISGEYWLDQAGSGGADGSAVGGELGVGRYHEHARNRFKASVFTASLRGCTGLKYHNLDYGLSVSTQKVYERSREWELRDSAGYSLPFDPEALKMVYSLTSNQDETSARFSFYAMDTYRLDTSAGYLNVNGGVRLSYWSYNKELLVSPRASVGFVPAANPRWSFRFATGLYYQSPFFREYRQPTVDAQGNTIIRLNPDIKSQRSLQFILGSDFTFRALGRPFKLSGEAYYKALGNLIPYEIDNLKLVYSGSNQTGAYAAGLDMKLFGQFVPGSDSWISFSLMKTSEKLNGRNVPRPNDRRYSLALFFTDYFPKFPKLKFNLRGILDDGLPTAAPHSSRDRWYYRAPAYKRLDIGLAYALLPPPEEGARRSGIGRVFKSIWLGADVFNLLDISNVSSYYWVTDVNNIQYAVPNYLTRRQFNIRLSVEF